MKTNEFNNYKVYFISKGNGKFRKISEPSEYLKELQGEIAEVLDIFLKKSDHSVGFVKKKRILDGAKKHKYAKCILNMDVKDFFDNIKAKPLREALKIAFTEDKVTDKRIETVVKIIEGLLWTEYKIDSIEKFIDLILKACIYKGATPQGSPSSPILSNIFMRSFDEKLYKAMQEITTEDNVKMTYSRYADDITVGFGSEHYNMWKIVSEVNRQLSTIKLKANWKKTEMSRSGSRKAVTGLSIGSLSQENHSIIMWIEIEKTKESRKYFIRYHNRGSIAISWSRKRRDLLKSKLHHLYLDITNGKKINQTKCRVIAGELSMLYGNDYANFLKYVKEIRKIEIAIETRPTKEVKPIISIGKKTEAAEKEEFFLDHGYIRTKQNSILKKLTFKIEDWDQKEERGIRFIEETARLLGFAIRSRNEVSDYIKTVEPA